MAKNLRSKIPQSEIMLIHDVNPAVTEQFAKEVGGVTVAQSVREIAEGAVRVHPLSYQTKSPAPPDVMSILFYL